MKEKPLLLKLFADLAKIKNIKTSCPLLFEVSLCRIEQADPKQEFLEPNDVQGGLRREVLSQNKDYLTVG